MDELKIRIIDAALAEFKSKGLKFTMADVAKRLRISKKTIYMVFESKEEMIDAGADYLYAEIKRKERELIEMDIDIVEKIKRVIIALPDNYNDINFAMLEDLKEKYPDIYAKVERNIETGWESTYELLREGQRQGRIRDINLDILKEIISSSIEAFIGGNIIRDGNIGYNEALEGMMDIILKGIVTG